MPQDSRRSSLLVVFLTVFTDLLGFGLLLPLIPVYSRELMGEYSDFERGLALGLLMTCYSIMQFIFAPLWGRVSDRVGRRPILILSLAGSTFFYGMFGLATMWGSLTWMFIARIGGGIAGATIPTAQAYIADVTPRKERTKGMALIGVAFGLGFTFGPLLGAVALITAGDASAAAAKAHLSPWPGFTASLFSAAALCLAIFKLRESLAADARTEPRRHIDLLSLWEAVRVPSVGSLLGTIFLCTFAFSAFEATLTLVLSGFLGVERGGVQILLAFAYVGLVQTLVQGGLVRWLAGFTAEGTLCLIGTALSIGGYLGLALASDPDHGGPVPLMIMASLVVAGLGFIYPSIQSLLSRRSDPARQGGILGVSGGMNSLARIAGVNTATMLFEMVSHPSPFWTAFALMCLVLSLVLLAVRGGKDWEEQGAEPAVEGEPGLAGG